MKKDNSPSRLKLILSKINPNKVIGVSGLAILCASAFWSIVPVGNQTFSIALGNFLGGLGLNVLASKLQGLFESVNAIPNKEEVEKIESFAKLLSDEIEKDKNLKRQISIFLKENNSFNIAEELVLSNPGAHAWLLIKIYQDISSYQEEFEDIKRKLDGIEEAILNPKHKSKGVVQVFPPFPKLLIGRQLDLQRLKTRLGVSPDFNALNSEHSITIIRGWAGVGKSTLVNSLAYDPDICKIFKDGVLWTSLGESPNILGVLINWGRALGIEKIENIHSIEEVGHLIRSKIKDKNILIIIDDVWEEGHAASLMFDGSKCATIITTRERAIAENLCTSPKDIYKLEILNDKYAFHLLQNSAPEVVEQYLSLSEQLVSDLEGLPLAIKVAGRMLSAELYRDASLVKELFDELKVGLNIIKAKAPPDRVDEKSQTIPTISLLLNKSTDRLLEDTRLCYAFLGAFAPKPATFDLDAMKAVWKESNPHKYIRELVDRGLLEQIGKRYQMHALLVAHAKSLLE